MPNLIRFHVMLIDKFMSFPRPDSFLNRGESSCAPHTFLSPALILCAGSMGMASDSSEQGLEGRHTGSAPGAGVPVSRSPSIPSIWSRQRRT